MIRYGYGDLCGTGLILLRSNLAVLINSHKVVIRRPSD